MTLAVTCTNRVNILSRSSFGRGHEIVPEIDSGAGSRYFQRRLAGRLPWLAGFAWQGKGHRSRRLAHESAWTMSPRL
jgi:hypothetical protein